MTAASYTTDLQSFGANVTTTTGWSEPTGFTDTDGSGEVDTDLSIYGTSCYTEAQRKTGSGGLFYTTTEPGDFSDGTDCIFGWFKFFAPNACGVKGANGIIMMVGSSSSNFNQYDIAGSDTYAYGGWRNFVVNPNTTTVSASRATGSPNGTHNGVGFGATLSYGIAKGNSYNIDIIRYGRGELIVEHGTTPDPAATFAGMAQANDNATTGRWGLFQDQGGSYLWKGLMTLGTATNALAMTDSNVSIVIDDTEFVQADFNKIEVRNSSTNIDWTSVTITALGTVSPGRFEVIDASAIVGMTKCTFSNMGTFIFKGSGQIIDGTAWIRCGTVTAGGAQIDNSVFDSTTSSVALECTSTDFLQVDSCDFTMGASNSHAIEITNLITTNTTINWTHKLSGYAPGVTGDPVVEDDGTDAALLCNVDTGVKLTVNVQAGATVPSIRNTGAGTVAVVSNFTHTLEGLELNTEVTYVTANTSTELFHVENATTADGNGKYKTEFVHPGGQTVDILIHNINYQPDISNIYGLTLPSADATVKVQMFLDDNYLNP